MTGRIMRILSRYERPITWITIAACLYLFWRAVIKWALGW